MNRDFILKCEKCGWHSEINQACKINPCPNCGRNNYNRKNLLTGTKKELEEYLKGVK